jgi:hypothetical protein
MTKFSKYAATVIAMSVGMFAPGKDNRKQTVTTAANSEAILAADGAFRDGLYLGKLAAEGGLQSHSAIGRWSAEQDRSMFRAGYERGYSELPASTANAR